MTKAAKETRRWGKGQRAESGEARQRIIAAARHCYAHKGIAATTMSDLAQQAGVVRGTLYRYFARKEDILLCIFREETAKFLEQFRALTPVPPSFAEYLLEYLLFNLRFAPETPMHKELFAEQSALWVGRVSLNDPATLAFTEDLFREPFRSAQANGEIHQDLTLPELVHWCGRIIISHILVPDVPPQSEQEQRNLLKAFLVRAITRPVA